MNKPITTAMRRRSLHRKPIDTSADIFSAEIRQVPRARKTAAPEASEHARCVVTMFWLDDTGEVATDSCQTQALPTFLDAFSALTSGAILQTRRGVIAVEDVRPGDDLRLADGSFDTVLWAGRMTLEPGLSGPGAGTQRMLTRFTADALGFDRPAPDLLLGPSARILHRARGVRQLTGCDAAFIPAADFVDGNRVISVVPNTVTPVYQLGFAGQRRLNVNGLEVETMHPGTAFSLGLRGAALADYLALFPHQRSLDDFGEMAYPRLRLRDLELLG